MLSGKADPQTLQSVGAAKDVLEALKRVTGNADEESLRTKETGIPMIKDRGNRYLNSERVTVLATRCDALLNAIINADDELYAHVSVDYPKNPG